MKREQALNQIEIIRAVMDENRKITSRSGPFLILWGVISIVGFGLTPYLKQNSGVFWIIAGFGGGLASAYIGRRDQVKLGKYAAHIGRRIGLVFCSMFVGGWTVTLVLLANAAGIDGPVLGVLIGIVWCALIALAWVATGILTDSLTYMIPVAGMLLVPAAIIALLAPAWFYPAIAIFGGGALLAAGVLATMSGR